MPAELTDDAVNHDLFQMYEVVVAATQGAIVDVEYVKQLRGHYQSLRKQAKIIARMVCQEIKCAGSHHHFLEGLHLSRIKQVRMIKCRAPEVMVEQE